MVTMRSVDAVADHADGGSGSGPQVPRTARWFIVGATLGGLTLGGAIGAAAIAFGHSDMGTTGAIAVTSALALVAAAVDAHLFGFGPPFFPRQVNQDWLSKYRSWVYGGGFGWQIGVGVTTYVMTAAVPLMILVGALTGKLSAALAIGAIFGLARGLAVLLGARARTPAALIAFHRRFEAMGEPVRRSVIGVQLGVAVVAALVVAPLFVAAIVAVAAIALLVWSGERERDDRAQLPAASK